LRDNNVAAEKCDTWRVFERLKQKKLGHQTDAVVHANMEKSIISASGLFRIHYDTSTSHTPALVTVDGLRIPDSYHQFADSVAKIFDEVYEIEINQFGYPVPAKDGIRGGGTEYDVYIENLGEGSYGYTNTYMDTVINDRQYPAYMIIDNDFGSGFYTKGLDGVRVTAAHEFHHVIEVSTSGVWDSDFYFYEMSATSMESTVYPDIRDYIQYIKTYFDRTDFWTLFLQHPQSGYERAIFTKFLMEKFGVGIMNSIWTEVKTYRPIPALQNVLASYSTTLQNEFSEFGIWNIYTGARADSGKYFVDAKYFPPLKYYSEKTADTSIQTIQASIKAFALQYHKIRHGLDTTHVIIANTNYQDAINELNQSFMYQYRFTVDSNSALSEVRPDLFAEFNPLTAPEFFNWKYSAITSEGIYVPPPLPIPASISCYPNPFNPSDPSKSPLNFNTEFKSVPELYIYSASMDLVFSGIAQYSLDSGRIFAKWDGRDNNKNYIPSGIYFYYLTDQKTKIRGKFAVIR
jgi:hypothetical protein